MKITFPPWSIRWRTWPRPRPAPPSPSSWPPAWPAGSWSSHSPWDKNICRKYLQKNIREQLETIWPVWVGLACTVCCPAPPPASGIRLSCGCRWWIHDGSLGCIHLWRGCPWTPPWRAGWSPWAGRPPAARTPSAPSSSCPRAPDNQEDGDNVTGSTRSPPWPPPPPARWTRPGCRWCRWGGRCSCGRAPGGGWAADCGPALARERIS